MLQPSSHRRELGGLAAPGASGPTLARVCVAQDGRVKANFSDNSILLVNSKGSAFTFVPEASASGTHSGISRVPVRQLSEYALSRHAPLLAAVLDFRNTHVDEPFYCRAILRSRPPTGSTGLTLGYELSQLWWPSSAGEALSAGLVQQFPDGRVALSTSDTSARMVLHSHRRRFAVCYPLLVDYSQQEARYQYVWHTQVFSLSGYPPRWHEAVQLLLQVVQLLDADAEYQHLLTAGNSLGADGSSAPMLDAVRASSSIPALNQGTQIVLYPPQSTAAANEGATGLSAQAHGSPPAQGYGHSTTSLVLHSTAQAASRSCTTHLPQATDRGLGSVCDGFPPNSWWYEPTQTLLPADDVITLEWTPQATYQFHPDAGEVQVWVHADDSVLTTVKGGRYVLHTRWWEPQHAAQAAGLAALATPQVARSAPGMSATGSQGQELGSSSSSDAGTNSQQRATVTEQLYAASCVPETVWVRPPPAADILIMGSPSQYTTASAALGGESNVAFGEPGGAPHHWHKHRSSGGAGAGSHQVAGQRYALGSLAAHALKFREQMMASAASIASRHRQTSGSNMGSQVRHDTVATQPGAAPAVQETFAVQSDEVVEHIETPGESTMTAYADGRVRAVFADRTIVHINGAHTHAKAYTPEGQAIVVAVDNPVGLEGYMQALLRFVRWAFKSPGQRAAEAQAAAYVRAQLAASQRMTQLLEFKSTGKLPSGIATQLPYAGDSQHSHSYPDASIPQHQGMATSFPTQMPLRPAPLDADSPDVSHAARDQSHKPWGASQHAAASSDWSMQVAAPATQDGNHQQATAWQQGVSLQDAVQQLLRRNAELLQRL